MKHDLTTHIAGLKASLIIAFIFGILAQILYFTVGLAAFKIVFNMFIGSMIVILVQLVMFMLAWTGKK